MKFLLLSFLILLLSCQSQVDVGKTVRNTVREYPGLFFSNKQEVEIKERIKNSPSLSTAFSKFLASTDKLLELDPGERELEGRRMLFTSRKSLKRIFHLSFAFRMTGNQKYLNKAVLEMKKAATFKNWNPSHFLDTAEMTAAMGIGFDLLYHDLRTEQKNTFRRAIIEKGLIPGLKDAWWVSASNNWNQVCHAGLSLGALAVMDKEPAIAEKVISRAVKNIPYVMAQYAPDGAYPEGPGYWNYGTTYNILLLSSFESVFKTDFGLSESPGFLATAQYYLHATGPAGLFFNYSDNRTGSYISPIQYWLNRKSSTSGLLWNEVQRLKEFNDREDFYCSSYFPLLFVWSLGTEKVSKPLKLCWKGDGVNPVAMLRSGWEINDTYIAVKGGSPGVSHGHMDIGSFVLDSQGVRWAEDLGRQKYHSLESKKIDLWNMKQNSQRWNVFRLNNFSHNTLVVDGKKQQVEGSAPIISFSAQSRHAVLDLTSAYKEQLIRARRGVELMEDGSVVIQDELNSVKNSEVRWGMLTGADVNIISKTSAILTKDGRKMKLEVLSPVSAPLEIYNTSKPRRAYDAPNPGTRMLGFKVSCMMEVPVRMAVLIKPLNSKALPILRPLAEWK